MIKSIYDGGYMGMEVTQPKTIAVEHILIAHHFLKDVVVHTPLQRNDYLSEKYGANIYFKREDLQHVRSFKLRGAYYKIKKLKNRHVLQGLFVRARETMHKVLHMLVQNLKFMQRFSCRKRHQSKKSIKCVCLVAIL